MAVNENGTSEPLRSSSPVTAKLPFSMFFVWRSLNFRYSVFHLEPPGAPGQPEINELTNNSATLHWDKPTSDGGGPITGYWIEKREENTDKWIPVNMSLSPSTYYTVPSLIEDRVYEFRVTAEKEAGKGVPSEATKPTKVKTKRVCLVLQILV